MGFFLHRTIFIFFLLLFLNIVIIYDLKSDTQKISNHSQGFN